MRSTTTTIETNITADRLVEVFVAGAAGVLAVSEGGATGAVGAAAAAAGVLTGSVGAAATAGVSDGFRSRADRRVE